MKACDPDLRGLENDRGAVISDQERHSPSTIEPSIALSWIYSLVDERSFCEMAATAGAEVIAGLAKIEDRDVAVYAHDPKVRGGFISSAGSKKIVALMNTALERQIPVIALLSSPGIALDEGLKAGEEYTRVIMANTRCSGRIPQIALIMGVVMGGGSYSAVLMDFVIFSQRRSYMMVSGPSVVEAAINEKATFNKLGGTQLHATVTGLAHFVVPTPEDQIAKAKELLRILPPNGFESPKKIPVKAPRDVLPNIPESANVAFDMESVIRGLVDDSYFLPYAAGFGKSMMTCFARLGGFVVGIVANQSLFHSGAITADAAQKSARFIRICDAYKIPVLTLIDVPGYMIGSCEEQKGIVRQGAAMIQAMNTNVAKFSVVIRRCYGAAAFVMMQNAAQHGDLALAVDGSRIAIMGYGAAKNLVFANQDHLKDEDALKAHYYSEFERPAISQQCGLVDEIIRPEKLRERLIQALQVNEGKPPRRAFPLAIRP